MQVSTMRGQGQEFMEKTKYENLEKSDQVEKIPQPPLELAARPIEC